MKNQKKAQDVTGSGWEALIRPREASETISCFNTDPCGCYR
jgi:ABC-type molybdate transport system substrate-binding protein